MNLTRLETIWGKDGQSILESNYVTIVGSGNIAQEVIKSLATLGMKNIQIIDNGRTNNEKFLDISMGKHKSKVKELDKLVKECFNDQINIKTFHTKSNYQLHYENPSSVIIDCTNDPEYQHMHKEIAKEKNIALFTIAADQEKGELGFFHNQHENVCNTIIPDYNNQAQGNIISHFLCGITVEEVRKFLFLDNIDQFQETIAMEVNTTEGFEINKYSEKVKKYKLIKKNIFFDINGNTLAEMYRKNSSELKNRRESVLRGSKILIVGAGALGNYCSLMLAQSDKIEIDIVDFDKFADHNLTRQYLAYKRAGHFKSKTISDRIKIINPTIKSEGIIGYVGETYDKNMLRKEGLTPNNVTLVNNDWIANRNYDIILGCFDNYKARKAAAEMAEKLKIPYIDGGSGAEPTRSQIYIYNPETNETISHKFNITTKTDEERNQAWRNFRASEESQRCSGIFIAGQSCGEYNPGSVSMGNQVASALMITEARKILKPQYYPQERAKSASYNSNLNTKIGIK